MRSPRQDMLVRWLLAAALALALWAPPEIYPSTRAVLAILAATLALGLLVSSWRESLARGVPPRGALVVSTGLLASAALSLSSYRSLHLLAGLAGACVFYAACRRAAPAATSAWLSGFLAISCVAAAWACVQAAGGMQATLQAAEAVQGPLPEAWRARLLSGRAFGTLLLPAALGGLMAMAVPVAAGVAAARRGAVRLAAGLAAGLCLTALALSRSYGALVAFAGAGVWAAGALAPRRAWRIRVAMIALLAMAVAGVAWARHESTGQRLLDPQGPVMQRWLNWRTAALIAGRYPVLGCGPGAYASAFVSARQPGENDTRFAHNTPLQMLAEAGLWVLLPLGYTLARTARRLRQALAGSPEEAGAAVGLVSFLVHNLVDFTAYLPSLLWAALALTAVLPAGGPRGCGETESRAAPDRIAAPGRKRRALLLYLGLALVCLAAAPPILRQCRGEILRDRARKAGRTGAARAEVAALYGAAIAADPGSPDLRLERASFLLQAGADGAEQALADARAAARADRGSASARFLQSVALAGRREWAEAYLEAAAAVAIHPRDEEARAWLEHLEQTLRTPASR